MTGPIDTLIVAGAPVLVPAVYGEIIGGSRTLIAVDAGATLCVALGRDPDVLVGDLDSIEPAVLARVRGSHTRVIELDPAKDVSDLEAALDLCAREGLSSPVLTAATGGRFDHALAVAGALASHAGLSPRLVEPDVHGWVLSPAGTAFLELSTEGTLVSVIPLMGPATVSIHGMRYPLDRRIMPALGSLGLSNVVEVTNARIDVHEGVVLVLVPSDAR